jgi:ElaB/YqjD/DUF883 family membrane-anchored ribosome-binding protein
MTMAPESEPEAIRQQMDETREALNDKIATLEQQVVDTVQDASAGVRETVEVLKDAVQDTVQSVRDSVGDTVESVRDTFSLEKQMVNRPWTVLAISAGVGFAAGYLLTPPARRRGTMPSLSSPLQSRVAPPPLSSHGPEGFVQAQPSQAAAFSGYESSGAAHPPTSSNGVDHGSREPQEPASASNGHGLFDTVAHAFEGEITALKGLALGALGGLVRDFVVPQIPATLKEKVHEIIDDFTTKLGGEPVRGPIFGEEKHDETHEEGSHAEPFGNRLGSRS